MWILQYLIKKSYQIGIYSINIKLNVSFMPVKAFTFGMRSIFIHHIFFTYFHLCFHSYFRLGQVMKKGLKSSLLGQKWDHTGLEPPVGTRLRKKTHFKYAKNTILEEPSTKSCTGSALNHFCRVCKSLCHNVVLAISKQLKVGLSDML